MTPETKNITQTEEKSAGSYWKYLEFDLPGNSDELYLDGWKYNITEMGINHKILIPKTLKMKLSLCRRPWSVVRLFPLTLNWTMSVNWNRPGSKNDFRWPRSGWAWSCYDFYLDWSLLCSRYHLVFKWSSTASYTTKEGYFLVFPPKSLFGKIPWIFMVT